MKKIQRFFFNRNTVTVAKGLLGKFIVRKYKGTKLTGRIVETEAYRGKDDPGSHAFRKKTPRNAVMFGEPGHAYVYFCYGNHYLFNIVTEKKGDAGAVLIRAVEPVSGACKMKKLRKTEDETNLTNGPAKFTQAFSIDKKLDGYDLTKNEIYIAGDGKKKSFKITAAKRIGIKTGLDKKWRFYVRGNKYVSVK